MSDDTTLNQQLAAMAADTSFSELPSALVDSVRQRVLDTVGICVAAADLDSSQAVSRYVEAQGGAPHATVIASRQKLPAAQAAFANGVFAHSLDYDDTHLPSILHPSASIVPAALAVAEREGRSGEEVLAAIAVGLEVCIRVGMAGYDPEARNSLYFDRGQHATSICGALGAAAAAAHLLDGTHQAIADSVAVTASMASGIIEANRTGGNVKRIHCGWAAHAGTSAADLVRAGITGPPTVFEGRFGFFRCFLDGEFLPEAITDGLGTEWAAASVHVKPYPANHFTHTAVDAARELRRRGIRADEVLSLHLKVSTPTVRTIGEPIEVKRRPETGYQAQFSGPYVLVAALLGGGGLGVSLADFDDDLVRDPARRALMDRVTVSGDPRCDAIYPEEFPAILEVELADGHREVVEVMANRGGPQDPLSDEEIATKFRENVAGRLDDGVAALVEDRLLRLHELENVFGLMADLRLRE